MGCIKDTSGSYLIRERGFTLRQVTKEDCIIRQKRWTKVQSKEEVKNALDEYYHEADALVEAQNKAMDAIEELGKIIDDHDTFVNIINHVQNPCMQVTATPENAEARPHFPRDEAARDRFDDYIVAMDDLASGHSAYMEKLWQLQQECSNQNTVLDLMNNVFIPPIQVTVTSRKRAEAEEGKTFQELATSCHTPDPQALPPNCSKVREYWRH